MACSLQNVLFCFFHPLFVPNFAVVSACKPVKKQTKKITDVNVELHYIRTTIFYVLNSKAMPVSEIAPLF